MLNLFYSQSLLCGVAVCAMLVNLVDSEQKSFGLMTSYMPIVSPIPENLKSLIIYWIEMSDAINGSNVLCVAK